MSDLEGLFEPASIAVVGATEVPGRFGSRVLSCVVAGKFEGPIYPVNPKYEQVLGLKCYDNLGSIPGTVDTVIFAIPGAQIAGQMAECGRKGVKLAVVLSSGFAEVGAEGKRRQDELVATARAAGVRVLGPNGLGFLNLEKHVIATTSTTLPIDSLIPSSVALVTQSGALGYPVIFSRAHDHGVGFRFVVAGGNEADLSSADVIRYYAEDPKTRVIAAMVEGIKDPDGFRDALETAYGAGKPVVILKVGRSEEGRRAVGSHTASMAGSDAVNDAIFAHYGVIRVDDVDELWEVPAALLSTHQPRGRKVALVSSSGGLGGLFADHVKGQGLELAEFSPETILEFKRLLPDFAMIQNPLDLTGAFVGQPDEGGMFRQAIDILTSDPGVDILVVAQVVSRPEVGPAVIGAVRAAPKTAVVLAVGGSRESAGLEQAGTDKIHLFTTPGACARTLRRLCERVEASAWRDEPPASKTTGFCPPAPPGVADHEASVALLEAYGIPLVRQHIAEQPGTAIAAAERLGYPVVAKAVAPGALHKSELGAVILDIRDGDAMRRAVQTLERRFGSPRILVQEMAAGGVEMIVGVQRDRQFGPVVLIGAGGTLVEVLGDAILAIPPFTYAYVQHRIQDLKAYRLLTGVRGVPRADIESLIDLVVKVGNLAVDQADAIESLDLNPVIVLPQGRGSRVVDWVVVGTAAEVRRPRVAGVVKESVL